MLDLTRRPRDGCAPVTDAIFSTSSERFFPSLRPRRSDVPADGVTFNVYGAADGAERIFPFDPIPRVIDAATWANLEAGLIQRVRALNAFLADIYGDGAILSDGVVPPTSSSDARIFAAPPSASSPRTAIS